MAAVTLQKKTSHMECPRCHAAFAVRAGQTESLCYNCGMRLNITAIGRDLAAEQLGWTRGYAELTREAQKLLSERKYSDAAAMFSKAAKAAPDDCDALFGLLTARTEHFTQFPEDLPRSLYHEAMACADPEQAAHLKATWTTYVDEHGRYWQAKREEEDVRRNREKERRRLEQMKRDEADRQAREAARQAQERNPGTASRIGRYVSIVLGAVIIVLGIAACAATGGGGMIFLLMGAGLLGGNGRNRNGKDGQR